MSSPSRRQLRYGEPPIRAQPLFRLPSRETAGLKALTPQGAMIKNSFPQSHTFLLGTRELSLAELARSVSDIRFLTEISPRYQQNHLTRSPSLVRPLNLQEILFLGR